MMFFCAVTAVGVGYLETQKPVVYIADATIMPSASRQNVRGGEGIQGVLMSQLLGNSSLADINPRILQSRRLIDSLIDELDLETSYGTSRGRVRRLLSRNSSFAVDSLDGSMKIIVIDADPNRAASIANAYPDMLDRVKQKLSVDKTEFKMGQMKKRITAIREELTHSQDMPTYEVRLKEQIFESLTTEYEMAQIQVAFLTPTAQVLDYAEVPSSPMPKDLRKKPLIAGFAAMLVVGFLWYIWDVEFGKGGKRPAKAKKKAVS